jgi:2-methylisocitrate lyase-like PEP mutase family enzyme
VREAASRHDLHLVINARVDSFLSDSFNSREERIEEAVRRAKSYIESGADCIYPIGPGDLETLGQLRERITAPINIFASPKALSLRDLHQLGINRVSFGPQVFRSCVTKFVSITAELKNLGTYECFAAGSLTGKDVSKFLISGKELKAD